MADDTPQTQPPAVDEATGFALQGGFPLNARLRAEALADAGKTTDPEGLVDEDLIASTGERLIAERADAAKAEADATPSMDWTKERLLDEAATRQIPVEGNATKAQILDAINAGPPASTEA